MNGKIIIYIGDYFMSVRGKHTNHKNTNWKFGKYLYTLKSYNCNIIVHIMV